MKEADDDQVKISVDAMHAVSKNLKEARYVPGVSDYEWQTRKPHNQKLSRQVHLAKKTERQKQAEQLGLTEAQLIAIEQGDLELEAAPLAYKYNHGENLLQDVDKLRNLPTRMR